MTDHPKAAAKAAKSAELKAAKAAAKAEKDALKAAAKAEKDALKAAAKADKAAAKEAAKEAKAAAKVAAKAAKKGGSIGVSVVDASAAAPPPAAVIVSVTNESPEPEPEPETATATAAPDAAPLNAAKSASQESLPPPPPPRVLTLAAEGDAGDAGVAGVPLRPKKLDRPRRTSSIRQSFLGAPTLVVPGVSNLSEPAPSSHRRQSSPIPEGAADGPDSGHTADADAAAAAADKAPVEELDVVEEQEDEEVGTMKSADASKTAGYLAAALETLRDRMVPLNAGGTNAGYIAAYQAMANIGLEQSSIASNRAANLLKNRYGNIGAYDHSRVVLPLVDGDEDSDYINANYVPGYNRARAYIASQGPVPSSFISFWRMVWLEKVEVIAMVTHEVEQGRMKCHRYWPDSTSSPPATKLQYGDVIVMHLSTTPHKHFVVREFSVQHNGEKRLVKQFAYTSWPDHGVPLTTAELLGFRNAVKASVRDPDVPLLIHCSAGVGRTGTYIAIDHLMEQCLDMGGDLDVDAVVRNMRVARNYMVQTEVQFIFIFRAVFDAISELLTNESQRAAEQEGAQAREQALRDASTAAAAEKKAQDEAENAQIESTRLELVARLENTASSAALIVASSLSVKDRMNILHEQKDKWLLHYKKSLDDWAAANQTVAEQYDLTSTLTLIQSRLEALRQKGLHVG